MIVKTHRLEVLTEALQANSIYRVDINGMNEDGATHLLLHRKEMNGRD